MPEITLDSTPFQGRTSSLPWRLPHDPLECRRCGSSLAGRRQAVRNTTRRGTTYLVEVFRCRCGRGRHVRREVATG